MQIPILNIYYLLCYAWDKLDEGEKVRAGISDYTEVVDLFARVLNNGVNHLFKRGLDRDYLSQIEEYSGLKGKVHFTASLKRNLFRRGQAICEFDTLEHDILHNRLIKATLLRLTKVEALDSRLKKEVWNLYWRFTDVNDVEIRLYQFNQVRIHRNNSFYDFILRICRLIIEYTALNENEESYTFKDFIRDDREMAKLFEAFIRNFYKKSQDEFEISISKIKWQAEPLHGSDTALLPIMKTDVTFESPSRKIIMDTKYYSEAMSTYYERERFHSDNLYQIFSYLNNLEDTSKNNSAEGILLYPTVEQDYDQTYKIGSHTIRLVTVDLSRPWRDIHSKLIEILVRRD